MLPVPVVEAPELDALLSSKMRASPNGTGGVRGVHARRHRNPQASLYQFAKSPVLLSQPLSSTASLLFTAATPGRVTKGITTWLFTASSFSLISMAARLTGSSSVRAAMWVSSYSLFCQRVMLRPCHLFALVAASHEQNWRRNTSGS